MKKIILLVLALSWIVLDSHFADGWQRGRFFPKGIPFHPGFSGKGTFFFGSPDWWGVSPNFPGYYPYYPYYYPPEDMYKRKYESPYPAEIKGAGRLNIQVIPGDADVLLDGYPLAIGREAGPFAIGLLAGKHQIEVRKEGYRGYQKEVEIKTAATTNLKIILERRE